MKQRTVTRSLLTTALAMLLVLATGGAVLAASSGPPVEVPVIPAHDTGAQNDASFASTNCKETYENGPGKNLYAWCFSDDGNVVRIEHTEGLEHVAIGTITEGWCVSAGHEVRGTTNGTNPNSGLLPATYPSPDKVRHRTDDGSLRIEQRFSQSPGNGQIVIKMNLRNETDAPLNNVYVTRFIDADLGNTTSLDQWTSGPRWVTSHEPGVAMLQLVARSTEYNANSMLFNDFLPTFDEDCYNATADGTVDLTAGDRSMAVMYQLGTIFPGEQKTVKFVYRIS